MANIEQFKTGRVKALYINYQTDLTRCFKKTFCKYYKQSEF